MIRVNHGLILLLILDRDVVFNAPENNLDNAVTVIDLGRWNTREDVIQEGPPLG